jgi:hypothetical protein
MRDNRRVQPYNVVAALDDPLPPGFLYPALELNAHRAEIPKTVDSTVDFAVLKDEPPPLAQTYERLHVDHAEPLDIPNEINQTGR